MLYTVTEVVIDREDTLTHAEVAVFFNAHPRSVTRWAKDGLLTRIREFEDRRYNKAEVYKFLGENTSDHPSDELLRLDEAAAMLYVDSLTIARWIKAGKIKGPKTPAGHYRVWASDIEAISKE